MLENIMTKAEVRAPAMKRKSSESDSATQTTAASKKKAAAASKAKAKAEAKTKTRATPPALKRPAAAMPPHDFDTAAWIKDNVTPNAARKMERKTTSCRECTTERPAMEK